MTIQETTPGDQKRDQALARVEQAAEKETLRKLRLCVKGLCVYRRTFTADDLHKLAKQNNLEVREARLYGALLKFGQKSGWCKPTEHHVKSKRPECHSRPIRVWASKIWRGEQ